MLAAVGDQNLAGLHVETAVAHGFRGDRFAKIGNSGRRRVLVVAQFVAGLGRRLDNMHRGWEVGFANAVANDGLAGRLQRLGLRVHGQRRAGG